MRFPYDGFSTPRSHASSVISSQIFAPRRGTTPKATAEQAEVVFARLEAVLTAANMALSDIVRLTVFLTDPQDAGTFVEARDRFMGDHKPGAIILVVKALAGPELKIEIEAIAARVD